MNIVRVYFIIRVVFNYINSPIELPAAGGNFCGSRHQRQTGINVFERVFDGFRSSFCNKIPPGVLNTVS